ncbi:ABC transporter permease subunit [Salipiger thiooxidans]|uniref:ABC transporter permease subunit n=1 Tax=Salipiger thiooxidans TaxID=282683 RepID=UPI001CD5A2C2|nr:ABC transporter permease subunit [Salipiger thiooxidans]MCA0848614.1 ABC transporter permease subunit [Salipiger thiooxidans]
MKALPVTAVLAGSALVFALAVAIPLGAWSAVRAERLADRVILGIFLVIQSAPSFWVALLLLAVVAVGTGLFPSEGYVGPVSLVLPAPALIALFTQVVRNSVLSAWSGNVATAAAAHRHAGLHALQAVEAGGAADHPDRHRHRRRPRAARQGGRDARERGSAVELPDAGAGAAFGGQRVAIARAQVLNLLADLRPDRGLSCLAVSHDLSVLRFLSHGVGMMLGGRIVERGSVERVTTAPEHDDTRRLLEAAPTIARSLDRWAAKTESQNV